MKRILALTLVLTLALGACAGLSLAEGDENFNSTGYPIANEPVTYTALARHSSQYADDYNEYEAIQYWTELTNVQFEWEYLSMTDWDTQINLKLAAGDIPDVIYSPLTTSQLQTYGVEGGMFLDYNEYIDEYMPNFKSSIEENPDLGSFATMLDGGMYALPRTLWTYNMATPIFYRGDMLEELGAEVPTTVDEFYDLLVLAKEHYADVEGFYPFLSQPSHIHNNLFPAFGDAYQVPYGDNGDGKVTYNYATDQFRRYLEFVHKLYAEGLVNPEIFTMDAATINAQVKAGQCFFLGNVGTQLTGEHYASGEVETKILPPLVSEWTDEMKTLEIATLGYAGRTINANTENPEYLLRYLDMFYTEIGEADINVSGVSAWLGTQGVNWDITEDGQCYYRIVPEDTEGLSEEEYKNKYVIDSSYVGTVVLDLFPINNPTQEMKAYESAENYYPYMKYRLMDGFFKYEADENAELTAIQADINTYVDTAIAQFITGTLEINDANWENYISTLNSMGLERALEIKQVGYERWNGTITEE